MKRIPFLPLSYDRARKIARHYKGWGETLHKFFPSLDFDLDRSDIELSPREWLSIAFYGSLMYTLLLFICVFSITIAMRVTLNFAFGVSFLVGLLFGSVMFMYFVFYPRLHSRKKIKNLEQNLPYALRHILIQLRSGVTLFNAMVSVGWGKYGALSDEFKKAVNEINTGKSEISALENLAFNNPSLSFRRILWQMINAMKSGSDIGDVLKNIVDNLTAEQLVAIKKYGSQLNPLALFYMMLVVIFPTLGIVFLLILFSFVGAAMSLEVILLGILGFLVFVQIMFIGLIKSKRPVGI